MAPNLTTQDRREKSEEAYKLSIKRVSYTEIGRRLDISRQLASTLVKEEKERVASDKGKEDAKQKAISTYESIIRYGWELLESDKLKANSLNQSGVMNSITAAQKEIDTIEGTKAPTKHEEEVNVNYRDYTTGGELEQLFSEIDTWISQGNGQVDSSLSMDSEPSHN